MASEAPAAPKKITGTFRNWKNQPHPAVAEFDEKRGGYLIRHAENGKLFKDVAFADLDKALKAHKCGFDAAPANAPAPAK